MSQALTFPASTTGTGNCVAQRLTQLGLTEHDVLNWIETDDLSNSSIAKRLGVSASSVRNWLLATPNRSAHAAEARCAAADSLLDKAFEVIDTLPPDGTPAQVARAREMRQHLEKRAAIRNPDYSERRIVDGTLRVPLELHQMTDAQLIELARKNGISETFIEGVAEALDVDGA